LFDEDFDKKYEIELIPTKFIVDRYGIKQFKTVRFKGEVELINKMDALFEILLNTYQLKILNYNKLASVTEISVSVTDFKYLYFKHLSFPEN